MSVGRCSRLVVVACLAGVLGVLGAMLPAEDASAGTYGVSVCGFSGASKNAAYTLTVRRSSGYPVTGAAAGCGGVAGGALTATLSKVGSTRVAPSTATAAMALDSAFADWDLKAIPTSTKLGVLTAAVRCAKPNNASDVRLDFGSAVQTLKCDGAFNAVQLTNTGTLTTSKLSARCVTLSTCANSSAFAKIEMRDAVLWISDPTTPSIGTLGGTLTQTGARSGTQTVTFSGTDNVGLRAAALLVDGKVQSTAAFACDATALKPCLDRSGTLSVHTASLANGSHTRQVVIYDGAGNATTTPAVSFMVSNADPKPTLDLSGALFAQAGTTQTPGSYDVTIAATNGEPAGTGPGVTELGLAVDGFPVDGLKQPCGGLGCTLTSRLWLNTGGLAAGPHTVTATATDAAGQTSSRSWGINVDSTRTVFTIKPTATVAEFASAMSADNLQWLSVGYTGVGQGGYQLGSESPAEGLDNFREDLVSEYGSSNVPALGAFVVGGNVESARLGALASRVTARAVLPQGGTGTDYVDPAAVESATPYTDAELNADIAAENSAGQRLAQQTQAAAAGNDAKAFAPSFGSVDTYIQSNAKRTHRFVQTMTFPMEAVGDVDGDGDKDESPFERDGFLDNGYEHDLKLVDRSYSSSLDAPLCVNEKERFWAQRKGYTWTTNFPDKAHAYFDENAGDNCKYLDFTIGLEYPLQLSPNKTYKTKIYTRGGDARYSYYYVNAQKVNRFCSTDPAYCSESAGSSPEGQPLAGPNDTVRTMECRRWRKGLSSRRTCDHLDDRP